VSRLYQQDAELYDIAFDWDVGGEVDWILDVLGRPRSILEPGCGSGRMLLPFADRGVEITGFDISEQMVELARRRVGARASVQVADMTDFDFGRTFDAAISPINTLLHLSSDDLDRHLRCMARHTPAYLVQVGLMDESSHEPFSGSHWEADRGGTKLKIDWVDEHLDFERGRSVQRSRIEVLEGPRRGEIVEETHDMTLWTPATWSQAIDRSPFRAEATYDAGQRGARARVDSDATGGLLWHLLSAL
jgi:SAM-dependent methyltransferase